MAQHGIQVAINHNGQILTDFRNPHQELHRDFKGVFRSRLISAPPNEQFEVIVTFNDRFKQFSEDGVLITIASGEYAQSFWIDYSTVRLTDKHIFSTFTIWDSPRSTATQTQVQMRIPQPAGGYASANWMNADIYCTNNGCVSVFIERGKLNDFRDNLETYVWVATDPPSSTRYCRSKSSQVVRSEWFHWLRSENGFPYLFEFRNTYPEDNEALAIESDDEMDHDSEIVTNDSEDTSSPTNISDDDVSTEENASDYESDNMMQSLPRLTRLERQQDAPSAHTRLKRRHIEALGSQKIVKLNICREGLHEIHSRPDRSTDDSHPKPNDEIVEDESNRSNPTPVKQEPTPDRSIRISSDHPKRYSDNARERLSSGGPRSVRDHRVVDLTSDDEYTSGAIQTSSTTNQYPSAAASGPGASQDDGDEEDIEDLEDQLEEVKLRRAIRAAKKKKAAKSKTV